VEAILAKSVSGGKRARIGSRRAWRREEGGGGGGRGVSGGGRGGGGVVVVVTGLTLICSQALRVAIPYKSVLMEAAVGIALGTYMHSFPTKKKKEVG